MSKASASSRETDVAVVGYGGAGAVAAITAADLGAKVLIVEGLGKICPRPIRRSWR